jgi:hypothetical protein
MKGYIKNKTPIWRHAMKRSVGPGQRIELDDLFEQYGTKHDLKPGKSFVDWLKQIKLKDTNMWEIHYDDESSPATAESEVVEPKDDSVTRVQMTSPILRKDLQVSDIVNMPVRQARAELKKITDLDLLKYALNEARQLANKDTLCIMLRRRCQELELTRR